MASAQNQKMTAFPLKAGACSGLLTFIKTHMLQGEASAKAMHLHELHNPLYMSGESNGSTNFNIAVTGTTGAGKRFFMQEILHHVMSNRGGNNERFLD